MQEDNYNLLGDRLKKELSGRGKSAEAARLLKKNRNTVTNWCASGNIPARELQQLGDAGIVDVGYVLTGERAGGQLVVKEMPGQCEPGRDDGGDFVSIPEYDIDVAAGNGRVVLDERPIGDWHFRRDWMVKEGLVGRDFITVNARGDSMEPSISDGDILLVDRGVKTIDRDAVYVIGLNDHLVVKRVQLLFGSDRLRLSSNNELYPPIELDAETANRLVVVGRVERVMKMGQP